MRLKHQVSVSAASVVFWAFALSAWAQNPAANYPVKPLRLIIPYAGGLGDTVGRSVAQYLSTSLGQPVIAINPWHEACCSIKSGF